MMSFYYKDTQLSLVSEMSIMTNKLPDLPKRERIYTN